MTLNGLKVLYCSLPEWTTNEVRTKWDEVADLQAFISLQRSFAKVTLLHSLSRVCSLASCFSSHRRVTFSSSSSRCRFGKSLFLCPYSQLSVPLFRARISCFLWCWWCHRPHRGLNQLAGVLLSPSASFDSLLFLSRILFLFLFSLLTELHVKSRALQHSHWRVDICLPPSLDTWATSWLTQIIVLYWGSIHVIDAACSYYNCAFVCFPLSCLNCKKLKLFHLQPWNLFFILHRLCFYYESNCFA